MNTKSKVAVCSRSFSKNELLRVELTKHYKNITFNDKEVRFDSYSLVEFLKGHDKAIVALESINESVLNQLPDLKVISKYGVGLDMIDLHSMHKYGIKLGWTGGVNKRAVSELVIANAISLLHKTFFSNSEVKKNKWYQIIGRQLSDCTVGIVGCGNIGKDLVKILQPFGCTVLVNDIKDYSDFYKSYNLGRVDLNTLLKQSDIITLHLPLNESTYHIINKNNMNYIKKGGILINFARGGLIEEEPLKDMIATGSISGLALDVLEKEPFIDADLAVMDNVFITPHIGGSTHESILAMGLSAIKGLDSHGDPLRFNKL